MSGAEGSSSLGPDVWKDLLNWTLKQQEEASAADPTTIPAAVGPISHEKKQWLEQVMEGTFMDMATRLQGLLDALDKLPDENEAGKESDITRTTTPSPAAAVEQEGLTSTERAEALWEEVQEHVENLDYALMFCQAGGLPTLFRFLLQAAAAAEDKEAEARAVPALAVLATLTQNNLPVQELVLQFPFGEVEDKDKKISISSNTGSSVRGVMPLLASFLIKGADDSSSSSELNTRRSSRFQAKALQAISCIIRGHRVAEADFVQHFALRVFIAALQPSQDARVHGKALFFLQALLGADDATRERGEELASLLPLVVPCLLVEEDEGLRHTAACVVSEMTNLLGGPTVVFGREGGEALREAMLKRRDVIEKLEGVEREEAEDELRFWEVLAGGGEGRVFSRDGERAGSGGGGGAAAAAAAVEEGEAEDVEGDGGQAAAAAPVLLLAPPHYLSGASNAP
ncbi:hypothetical protein VYU27_000462 [Nannochloropsis oceanica]